jgi:hypothetical protein
MFLLIIAVVWMTRFHFTNGSADHAEKTTPPTATAIRWFVTWERWFSEHEYFVSRLDPLPDRFDPVVTIQSRGF